MSDGRGDHVTGTGLPRLVVVPEAEVSATAAGEIAAILRAAVAARGVAHWATTGGSAAPGIYAELAALPAARAVPWDRVHTWWGDDRFVPHDDPLSNVLPIESLGLAAETLHPIPTDEAIARGEGPAWAAERYAAELAAAVVPAAAGEDTVPALDLVILGVGPDGHVLSVFPGSAVWDSAALVCAVPAPTHIEPHVERVTFHPRLVAAARAVIVITAGASKAANLGRAWAGGDVRDLPLRATRLPTATWVLDEDAAADLPRG
jgi:6-phosphogluconolactonase